MPRRRRAQSDGRKWSPFQAKMRDLGGMLLVALIAYALFRDRVWAWTWVLLAIAVLGAWWLFFMPTYCDQVLRSDSSRQCSTREVRGKLRGCWSHRRDKRDAVFALLGQRNPGALFRFSWTTPDASTTPVPLGPLPDATVLRETWTLLLTAVSTVAGVASAVFAVVYA